MMAWACRPKCPVAWACAPWPTGPASSARLSRSSVCIPAARASLASCQWAVSLPKSMPKKTKVVLVDDHPLVREWLATLINQQPDLEVSGDADSAPKALQVIGAIQPDIAIVDISMEGGSGIELIKNIRASHPNVVVVVLSMHDESVYAERALRAGARGYIMK